MDVSAVTQNTTTYPATSQKIHPSDYNPPHTNGFTNSSGSSKEQGQGLRKKRRTLAAKVVTLTTTNTPLDLDLSLSPFPRYPLLIFTLLLAQCRQGVISHAAIGSWVLHPHHALT